MRSWIRDRANSVYERLLKGEIDGAPAHVAVIQDGNRRYARKEGEETSEGHREGAETTEALLEWCDELGIEELTLYTFSTENFDRPADQRAVLFDLIEEKLYDFADADRVHEAGVRIRAIGETHRLPTRVREAIDYAESRTEGYDQFHLNIALAYGGRAELLGAVEEIASDVDTGDLDPGEIDVETVENRLYEGPTRDVDLIVRTGGDERTSNFLPWHANGNEAAAYFCAPYWPEFRKIDFLRAIRTYEHRADSWRRTRARRALALVRAVSDAELHTAKGVLRRFRDSLSPRELEDVDVSIDPEHEPGSD
ncbi:Tritranspolycis-undecaprenyl-diphosphate synthase geranylgeranyl-diphosphate specific protein [Halorhabdus tiamatea SARL4B]|uniref:Tritrans,polycis-undecaprenyl-diphosphate synthase (geranylgeranyl-diphosphate specific) n=1 Tax=Halorhabdus tiamatea SARL4B TaxID=1033806 RepID=F7PIK7_9EURY|nr:polyprenyl diphosphate synthase [Halorhabdus tiamatea]ERJ07073.1 Tritranspolycis-undecaprenyl-diphosphate synthase geranylgeranyl-diphosphate specific protein [Halorhabdus tiamatea SARL4B]CCQ34838.1 undecaprenyl pyrophosphate synthetase [Halorhabdus tiamatea SARL4B]